MRRTIFTRSQRDCRGKQACLRFSIQDTDIISIINLSIYLLRSFQVLPLIVALVLITFHCSRYSADTRRDNTAISFGWKEFCCRYYRRHSFYFLCPLSFFTTTPFSLPRVAQMHRGKSFYLKARRQPSCLHLNCFGLNRSCASICRLLASSFSSSSLYSLVRDFARKIANNGGNIAKYILLLRIVTLMLQ